MKISTLVILGVSLLLSISGCSAEDHYVNNTTTSTNWDASVNISTPCTVATAMSNAVAGDVVYFRGGVYALPSMDESYCDGTGLKPVYYPANEGTSGNPITFMAYPSDVTRPFFNNSANENKTCTLPSYGAANTDWIVWDGIDSKAVQQSGSTKAGRTTCFYDSHHCTIKNAQLEGCPGNSNNNAIMLRSVDYATVDNCLLWNVLPYPISPDLTNPAGIELYYAEHCVIKHVTMKNCTNGIYDKGYFRQNITVHNCLFHNMDGNMDRGIQSATKWDVQINKSFHNNIFLGIRAPITINHIAEQTGGADGYDIYNNVFYDCDIGVAEVVYGDGGTQYCKGVRIHSNIISMPVHCFVDLNSDCEDVDSYIDYNDYYTTDSPMWWYNRPDAGYQKTSFELWNAAIPASWENNSIESNPLFINPGTSTPTDYKLGTGSPCIGAGKDGVDMGVFVTGNEIIGYAESPAFAVATIAIGDATGTVTIPITITDAVDVGSCDITLSFDRAVVRVTEVSDGAMDCTYTNVEHLDEGWVRIGATQGDNPGMTGAYSLLNIMLEPVGTGTSCDLNLSVATFKDATPDCTPMSYEISTGTYTTPRGGDANSDGAVDLADAAYIAYHVLGINGYEYIDAAAADVNGDGIVDMSDSMYISKHVLGYPGFEDLR